MDGTEKKQPSFEQSMERLEKIIASLEKGDAPLQDALRLFEEGAGLLRSCTEILDQAEQTIVTLQKGMSGAPVEAPFEAASFPEES
jgi:exodeoxyribonuclease VII small subunit